jgi:hypothetical protein
MQYKLQGGGGLALGGILAGFQITSLNSLCNRGLWSRTFTRTSYSAYRLRSTRHSSGGTGCCRESVIRYLDTSHYRMVGIPPRSKFPGSVDRIA